MGSLLKLIVKLVSFALLLLDNNFVTSQEKACIDTLPPFTHQGNQASALPVGIQVLVPSYEFSCSGRVHSWGLAIQGTGAHGVHMQVWRPGLGGQGSSYSLVGSNYFYIKPFWGERITYLRPDGERRIAVMQGDVVGFYLEDSPSVEDDFRLQYLENQTGASVMYAYSDMPYACVKKDALLNQLNDVAPIITIHLEQVSVPTESSLPSDVTTPTTDHPSVTKTTSTAMPTTITPTSKNATLTEVTVTPTTATPTTRTTWLVILSCVLVGSVVPVVTVVLLVTTLCLYLRGRRKRRRQPQGEKGVANTPSISADLPDVQDSTQLTANPAYDYTHNGLVASLTWLPKQGKFQLWKAQYYETPVISEYGKKNQKLERSYHHYEIPKAFLQSSHHYEQI